MPSSFYYTIIFRSNKDACFLRLRVQSYTCLLKSTSHYTQWSLLLGKCWQDCSLKHYFLNVWGGYATWSAVCFLYVVWCFNMLYKPIWGISWRTAYKLNPITTLWRVLFIILKIYIQPFLCWRQMPKAASSVVPDIHWITSKVSEEIKKISAEI